MSFYTPMQIVGNKEGLIQGYEEFLYPQDAYVKLINAYVWRQRIKRKKAFELLGRLRRVLTTKALGNTDGAGSFSGNLITLFTLEFTSTFQEGSISVSDGTNTFTDNSLGILTGSPTGSGTINYVTGDITITGAAISAALTINFNYYPSLPVMGIRTKEITATNNEQTIFFDTTYAYRYTSAFQEYLPGTTWTGSDSDFFWSTNYWVGNNDLKIFWVTNDKDPIRYTNGQLGTNWIDFSPVINASLGTLNLCLCMLPFRGRMVVFNTEETDGSHPNRIRWAQIGNPFNVSSTIVTVAASQATAWRDDIRGKGGFLDIPTNEDIITVGFVRDNLVVYCERSTWQLRYTGQSIAPFQIEKVNTELGVESTFSAVQFDTSLVGIGDKGIVECDSFKSVRFDDKIPDLVINQINNTNNGTKRVQGIRDFRNRLAFWIYPDIEGTRLYPNRRLVYNYEDASWAIFTDSLTSLGTFQSQTSRKWNDKPTIKWRDANFPWVDRPALFPSIMGGNQQGFVLYLDQQTTNQESLYISDITGFGTGPTNSPILITSPNHNMEDGQVISILNIPTVTPFATELNDQVFAIDKINVNSFKINRYNPETDAFDDPALANSATYIGGGLIRVRDNFIILSKKFNHIEQGKQFQLGYIDVLFDNTPKDPTDETIGGAISLNVYLDYNINQISNKYPQNVEEDTFFNSIVETTNSTGIAGGTKNWKRVFCPTNSNFVSIEWTLSNEQMSNVQQESDVQIDAQIIWSRVGGRMGITN